MKNLKLFIGGLLLGALTVCGPSLASAIKVWSNGEVLSSTDLNANFAHIHNTMVGGGHGARLVNADVNASAAIAHSKMATPALLPRAWFTVLSTCAASPCTVDAASGISGVTRSGAGVYTATLSTARADTTYAVFFSGASNSALFCVGNDRTTTTFVIRCYDAAGVATDSAFNAMILDNN